MHRRHVLWMLALTLVLPATAAAQARRIILNGGAEIQAEVLKAEPEAVYVDLGWSVLRIPRDQIAAVAAPADDAAAEADPDAPAAAPAWQLYHAARLPWTTIERASERFSEAVVMVSSPGGQGSGFVIHPDGHLITNYHVISGETRLRVTVFRRSEQGFEQRTYDRVRIVAINPFVDLALLKIEDAESPLRHVYLGSGSEVRVGQQCFAIGNPLGLTRTVSQGIVSTNNRNVDGRLYIQTTTDINPGNSGGPLFNLRGEVIGVTSMGYIYLGGLNFAIPVDVVKSFVDNRDAFAYDQDNPNSGFRYLQPGGRASRDAPPTGRLPTLELPGGQVTETRQ